MDRTRGCAAETEQNLTRAAHSGKTGAVRARIDAYDATSAAQLYAAASVGIVRNWLKSVYFSNGGSRHCKTAFRAARGPPLCPFERSTYHFEQSEKSCEAGNLLDKR